MEPTTVKRPYCKMPGVFIIPTTLSIEIAGE
jgi:hypothetical protein